MIRSADYVDIPAIVSLMLRAFERSHYAQEKGVGVDVAETKRLLVTGISRNGHKTGGATWVQVAETNGIVTGFIFGTTARVYAIGNKLMATDVFWYCEPVTSPADSIALMDSMVSWAWSIPEVVEVKCGVTAVVGDFERPGKLLQNRGFDKYGEIYRLQLERNEK